MKSIIMFLIVGLLFMFLSFLVDNIFMIIITTILSLSGFIIHSLLLLEYLNKESNKN